MTDYDILGISYTATDEEVKVAYLELVKKWHPDINKSPDATKKLSEINVAYDNICKARKNGYVPFESRQNEYYSYSWASPFSYQEEINKIFEEELRRAKPQKDHKANFWENMWNNKEQMASITLVIEDLKPEDNLKISNILADKGYKIKSSTISIG
jgi:DnaJ-class molecular chaperone